MYLNERIILDANPRSRAYNSNSIDSGVWKYSQCELRRRGRGDQKWTESGPLQQRTYLLVVGTRRLRVQRVADDEGTVIAASARQIHVEAGADVAYVVNSIGRCRHSRLLAEGCRSL